MSKTFYGGICKAGKHHVLVIDGKDWYWKKDKFTNARFGNVLVGANFTIDSQLDDKTLTVQWDTLDFDGTTQDREDIKQYITNDATQKKNRALASVKKRLDADNIQSMTIRDLKEASWAMNKSQKAALVALIISEVGY